MNITILRNSVNNSTALQCGMDMAVSKCAGIGLPLQVTYKDINKSFDSITISSDVVASGYAIKPEEILPLAIGGEDVVCLISPYSKVIPNNFSTSKPINPCTWDLDKTTLNNTIVMEVCEDWYADLPEVLCSFFLHELCHALYDKTGKLPDLTHSKYANSAFSQKSDIDYYLFLLNQFKPMNPTYKYFKLTESTGSDGHTVADLKPELVQMLDKARGIAGVPFKITSGYRDPSHNAEVGGVMNSAHELGLAVDLAVSDTVTGGKINDALHQVGFHRFGYYQDGHIHVDMANDSLHPSPCYWVK